MSQTEHIPADLKATIFLFRYSGMWRPFKNSAFYTLLTAVWFVAFGILFPFTQFMNLYYCKTVEELVDHFFISVTCLNGTFKAINIYLQQQNIRKVFELHEMMLKKSNKKSDDAGAFNRIKKK